LPIFAQEDIGRAAGYIAKYATKATEVAADGLLLPRLRTARDVANLEVQPHAKRLVEAAWLVGGEKGTEVRGAGPISSAMAATTLTKSHGLLPLRLRLSAEREAAWAVRPSARCLG